MKRNPNFYGLIAMFIAMLMVAALGPVSAKSVNFHQDLTYMECDVGTNAQTTFLYSSETTSFIALDRGASVPGKFPMYNCYNWSFTTIYYVNAKNQTFCSEYRYKRPREGLRCGARRELT
jgi:hypothetical protein